MNLDQFAEYVAETNGMHSKLVALRGGCTCFISPPCGNCVEPITEDEAEYLGWEAPEPEQPLHKILEQWR